MMDNSPLYSAIQGCQKGKDRDSKKGKIGKDKDSQNGRLGKESDSKKGKLG